MEITTESKRNVLIVTLAGDLDEHTAGDLRVTVERELDKGIHEHLLLNLSGLEFMDSSGLGVILGRYRRINQAGGRVAVCDLTPQVARIFEFSGLARIIRTYPTEKAAMAYLQGGAS